jgi:hypothetical protein
VIFGYNPELISACALGHSPGFMAGKQGYMYERKVVDDQYARSEVKYAIQCDITNVLRLADVMVSMSDGRFIAIECKGTKSGRSQRQKKKAEQKLNFLQTGIFELGIKELAPLHSYSVPVRFNHYWNELEELAKSALQDGISWRLLDNSLIIQVVDTKAPIEQSLNNVVENFTRETDWNRKSKLTISSLGRHLSKDLDFLPLTRLPLTIFPLSTEVGLQFVVGRLDAVIILNKEKALKPITEKGLECRIREDGSVILKTPLGQDFEVHDAWDKILNELVTISSFADYVHAAADKIDTNLKQ